MGSGRTVDPAGQARRRQAHGDHARGGEWPDVHSVDWLSVAGNPPKDLPPRSTLYDYFDLWSWDGTLDRIHHELYVKCREAVAREASPTAAVIDSQSVKSAEGGVDRSSGLRRGKEDQGQEAAHSRRHPRPADPRHLVHAADIQDRDGGALVMATMFGLYPFLLKLYADGGYQGPVFRRAASKIMAQVNVEIVKRSDHAKGFVVLPKRWVVERTFAWLGRCRRLAKDCIFIKKALAFLRLASIRPTLRKLSQSRMISPDRLWTNYRYG